MVAAVDESIPNLIWKWVNILAPVFFLHSEESYFPCDFNDYISRCQLKNQETGEIFKPSARLDGRLLGEWATSREYGNEINDWKHTLVLQRGLDDPIVKHRPSDLGNVPIYAHVLKRGSYEFYITYVHMYAYNGNLPTFFGLFHLGEHFADMEHVTLHVRFEQSTLERKPTIVRVYFSRHFGGTWIANHNTAKKINKKNHHHHHHRRRGGGVEMEILKVSDSSSSCDTATTATGGGGGGEVLEFDKSTGRLVVYASKHSHASYNSPGNKPRFWNMCPDVCNRGIRWQSRKILHVNRGLPEIHLDLKWVYFNGSLGDGHVRNFPGKHFMKHEDVSHNYGEGFCFSLS